ncbi:hypothetical protein GGS23DRAFT_400978 [Durotheca rogersii]|uniref:uncharacterized protein n=1 Tax=Durotheca rogersii TaxID=419775 RepID=UPI002220D251|nr:uncharacterized protein GGS23DRAFT_400978 [Durotheca rogersii]KAI5856214.1 hypothetical protein GGS23DRAFT_400978 [Durotheca rogersii]
MLAELTLASLLASLPLALAVPEVTVKALPSDCSSFPGYNAAANTAGPWTVELANSENAAIESFSDTSVYSIKYDPRTDSRPTLRWGSITFPTRNDIAKNPLKCEAGVLKGWVPTDLATTGAPTSYQWIPLVFSPYSYDAALMWKIDGEAPEIFEHYIGDEKQDGVFLGFNGSTTWGLKYYPQNAGSSGQDYYYARLLGPNSADPATGQPLKANETVAFVKISA